MMRRMIEPASTSASVLLGIAVLLSACGTDFRAPAAEDDMDLGGDENVYLERCSMCHGESGDGTTAGPQIRNPVRGFATYVIRNGRASEMGYADPMPSFSEGEVSDLEPIFTWLERPPHPTDGPTLYVRYCGNCHGSDARGGRVSEDITHEAREGVDEISEKVREGNGGTNYAARKKYMPAWSASELSDADVSEIAKYIASLPAGPGDHDDDDDDD